ncbi:MULTISPECIES: GNAT family N-acetyltransferase [unclassified Rhodococcus (in: high G+C Gram-positive bacteria)]|uniref:GNAT family N-acetyltransferase n=1 Tax=unclassified Rhodococcus (in: high G+C Gram-positive bacteria) TaxID=192944 RepID=UPI001639DFAF|nr:MULTISPECIES: GNAT family N-acetyltransferase [unclassified Rhodococcus (in: high G+C Gram-positive bacteria)]MBC2643664.1 GNAT family N-acetyltransferase [Rhodococcus sp. 3A]MBC2891595.1 GNAT family N-acetyltransferase [Rhodococcus sp. 4CII]
MIEIRNATPDDYEAVADLTVIAYVGGGFVESHDPYTHRLRDTAERAEHADVRVAVQEGRIVGSVTIAEPASPYADVAQPGELEFRMLAVSPDARGAGVGTALVRHVLDTAYDRGDRAVVMSTQPDMEDARRIYDRNGFLPVPERNWVPVPGVELTVLVRELV